MRNLTIHTTSAISGSIPEINVFITDSESDEMVIGNIHCRKLGAIKNNDTVTFQITEDAAMIIVASEREGKNNSYEFHKLEAGSDDVALSGKAEITKSGQIIFNFGSKENQTAPQATKKHTVAKRWLVRVLIFAICIFLLRSLKPEPKTFSEGPLSINLTTAFEEKEDEDFFVKFSSKDVAVYVDRNTDYKVRELQGIALTDYAKNISEQLFNNSPVVKTENGLTMLAEEEILENGKALQYYVYFYKTLDSFWMVEFAVYSKNAPKYQEQIEQWASSVEFYKNIN